MPIVRTFRTVRRRRGSADALVAWLIGPVLLLVAAWFIWGPATERIPLAEPAVVTADEITTAPPRAMPPDPPWIFVGGFEKKCSDCHSLFRPNREQPLVLTQHRDIPQAHGMNDRCFNCHDEIDPSLLVIPGGDRVPLDSPVRLCASCHGPTFRDWQLGMHGRTEGSWSAISGAQSRLICIQCHDPHAPAFPPYRALPGPNTLRMGEPRHGGDHASKHDNPLRQWSRGEEPHE